MRHIAIALLLGALAACGGRGRDEAATDSAGKAAPEPVRMPLERGYFVRGDLPCAEPVNDYVILYRGDGVDTERESCAFESVKTLGANRYEVVSVCTAAAGGGQSAPITETYTVNGPMAYSVMDEEGGEYGARFCAQAELPEPWRSRDISALLK
jgi:hypothetical protein